MTEKINHFYALKVAKKIVADEQRKEFFSPADVREVAEAYVAARADIQKDIKLLGDGANEIKALKLAVATLTTKLAAAEAAPNCGFNGIIRQSRETDTTVCVDPGLKTTPDDHTKVAELARGEILYRQRQVAAHGLEKGGGDKLRLAVAYTDIASRLKEAEEMIAESLVVCPGCSQAGGADRNVYHMPPICGQEKELKLLRDLADAQGEYRAAADKWTLHMDVWPADSDWSAQETVIAADIKMAIAKVDAAYNAWRSR